MNISFIDYEKQVVQVTVFEQHRTTSTNSYTEAREPKNNGELHLQRPQEELEFWSDKYRPQNSIDYSIFTANKEFVLVKEISSFVFKQRCYDFFTMQTSSQPLKSLVVRYEYGLPFSKGNIFTQLGISLQWFLI